MAPATTSTTTTETPQEPRPTWQEILGSNNWEGLLDPLDLDLRIFILRCGDFIQATYYAFNNDRNPIYCGSSRYGKSSFFHKVMLDNPIDYRVTNFLYATARDSVPQAFLLHSRSRESWDRESNWIGYIALSSDELTRKNNRREIYVVWRGTTRDYEWVNVLSAAPISAKGLLSANSLSALQSSTSSEDEDEDEKMPKVMRGWLTIYTSDDLKSRFNKTSAREPVLKKVKGLLDVYKDENPNVVLVGHSQGTMLCV